MSYPVTSTQSQALTALRSVLLAALPAGVEVVQGQDNRVPEPAVADFVVMTPILRTRLETNTDLYQDAAFTGSIAAKVLTVSAVTLGTINTSANLTLFGTGVTAGTKIVAQTSGAPGGAGAYTISTTHTLTSQAFAAGIVGIMQPTQLTVQCDVHGPASADNVQIISTVLRSLYGCDLFAALGYDVTPLFASDPRQTPFQNAEQQIERQWSVDVQLQVNPSVLAPQQFTQTLRPVIEPPADAYPH